jgi:hypothetical protein
VAFYYIEAVTAERAKSMRVQTYALWVHRQASPRDGDTPTQPRDELANFIDGLIAQVTYYPSFITQIIRDAQGLQLAGKQRVVEMNDQSDGMVALRTEARAVWVTRADYLRLLAI